jgi:hypothetical protein
VGDQLGTCESTADAEDGVGDDECGCVIFGEKPKAVEVFLRLF